MRPIRLQHGLLPLIARPNDAFFACAFSANAEYDLDAVLSWAVEIAPRYGTDRTSWVSADVVSVAAQIITVAAPLDTVTDTVDSELTLADVVGLGPCAWSMTAYGAADAFLWRVQGALDFVDGLELPSDGSSGIGSPISIDLGEGVTIALTILGNIADGGGTVDNAAVNAAIADNPSTTRTALGLGSAALSATGDFDASGAAAAVAASLAAHLSDTTDVHALASLDTAVTGAELDADHTKLAGIETAATADQTTGEIRIAYESERSVISQAEAEAGSETTVRLINALRIKQAVDARIATIIDGSPGTLDTLNELAAALGDDPNFAATVAASIATKQPLDATLTALAGLVGAANKLPYFTGDDVLALADFTAAARTLLAAADVAAQRAALVLAVADNVVFGRVDVVAGSDYTRVNSGGFIVYSNAVGTLYQGSEALVSGGFAQQLGALGTLSWRSTNRVDSGSVDTLLRRVSAGVLEINNGTNGQYRDLMLRYLIASGYVKITPVALASLVAAATAGDGATANITDALAPVLGAVAVGGGAEKVTVRSNGTSWLVDSVPAPGTRTNAQTGTSYTLVLADAGKLVTMNNASASTWTIPTNAAVAFPVNTEIAGAQLGAGTVTIDGSGVTLRSVGGLLAASAQYASWCAVKIATDEWLVTGQLA